MECVDLVGYNRNDFDNSNLRKAREGGNVPGVLYGCGVLKHFFVPCFTLKNVVYTNKKYILNFNLNGDIHTCMLKDIQFHPVSEMILHVDFLKIDNKKKVLTILNITTDGTPVGVGKGGLLLQKKKKLKVFGLPKDIPSLITLNISSLDSGDTLRVSDLDRINGCEYKDNPVDPIFTIKAPGKSSSTDSKSK